MGMLDYVSVILGNGQQKCNEKKLMSGDSFHFGTVTRQARADGNGEI